MGVIVFGNSINVCIVVLSSYLASSFSSSCLYLSLSMVGGVPTDYTNFPLSSPAAALGSYSACVTNFGGDGCGRSRSLVDCVVIVGSCVCTLTSFSFSTDFWSSSTLTNIGLVHNLAACVDWSRILVRSSVVKGLMF